jgi:hypothetical protein
MWLVTLLHAGLILPSLSFPLLLASRVVFVAGLSLSLSLSLIPPPSLRRLFFFPSVFTFRFDFSGKGRRSLKWEIVCSIERKRQTERAISRELIMSA